MKRFDIVARTPAIVGALNRGPAALGTRPGTPAAGAAAPVLEGQG